MTATPVAAPGSLTINYTGNQPATNPGLTPGPSTPQAPVSGPLPAFEDAPVSRTEIKMSGAVAVETRGEITVSLDDRLRVCGDFRVVKVLHYVDKDGAVVRQQVIAPIDDLELVPWDAANPNDNGILRAR